MLSGRKELNKRKAHSAQTLPGASLRIREEFSRCEKNVATLWRSFVAAQQSFFNKTQIANWPNFRPFCSADNLCQGVSAFTRARAGHLRP